MVEDLTKVQTPQAIQARAELQDLVLSHLNPERGMGARGLRLYVRELIRQLGESLVSALLRSIPTTDQDMVVQSIINIYASSDGTVHTNGASFR